MTDGRRGRGQILKGLVMEGALQLCWSASFPRQVLNTQVLIVFFSSLSCVSERCLFLKMIEKHHSSYKVNRPTRIEQNHHPLPTDTPVLRRHPQIS